MRLCGKSFALKRIARGSTSRLYLALTAALRAARRVNPFAGHGLGNDRQEAGAVAGRAYLFDYV